MRLGDWCRTPDRNSEIEGRAYVFNGCNPDLASIALDDFLAHREPDSASRNFRTVEPLEWLEDLRVMGGSNSNPIVAAGEQPCIIHWSGCDVNTRRLGGPIANGVSDQILKICSRLVPSMPPAGRSPWVITAPESAIAA